MNPKMTYDISPKNRERLVKWNKFYRTMMFDDVIPFWVEVCPDRENGGYLTYVDRERRVFSGIKSVWIQGRGVWLFAHLYNTERKDERWLDLARLGARFITEHCFDTDGTAFLATTREGKPLSKGLGFFSEAFIIMGYSELAIALDDKAMYDRARALYERVVTMYDTPDKPLPYVFYPAFHQMKGHANSMIMLSVSQVLRNAACHFGSEQDEIDLDHLCARFLNNIGTFYRPELGCLVEGLALDDKFIDEPDGRITCPGHSCESAWFILDEAYRKNDNKMKDLALKIIEGAMKFGLDRKYGGILTFVDCKGLPIESLEHDLKIWWPHSEALVALLSAWRATGNEKWLDLHEELFAWTMTHFHDKEFGEWYGYLLRNGEVSNNVKGNMWKGLFHVPRALLKCARLIEDTL